MKWHTSLVIMSSMVPPILSETALVVMVSHGASGHDWHRNLSMLKSCSASMTLLNGKLYDKFSKVLEKAACRGGHLNPLF